MKMFFYIELWEKRHIDLFGQLESRVGGVKKQKDKNRSQCPWEKTMYKHK